MSMSTLRYGVEAKLADGNPQEVFEPRSAQYSFGPSPPLLLVNNSGSEYHPSATERAACDELNGWRTLMDKEGDLAASVKEDSYWRAQSRETEQTAKRRWLKERELFEKRFPGKECYPAGVFLKRDE